MVTNETHPELREGEMFLMNATPSDYNQIGYKSKRAGVAAYDTEGNRVKTGYVFFPVFVQKAEYDENMKGK